MTRFFSNSNKVTVTTSEILQNLINPIEVMVGQVHKAAQFGKPANVRALDVLSGCVAVIKETIKTPSIPLDVNNKSVSTNEENASKVFSSGA